MYWFTKTYVKQINRVNSTIAFVIWTLLFGISQKKQLLRHIYYELLFLNK